MRVMKLTVNAILSLSSALLLYSYVGVEVETWEMDNLERIEGHAATVEVLFRPYACYPENTAPRFIHIQDPEDFIQLSSKSSLTCWI